MAPVRAPHGVGRIRGREPSRPRLQSCHGCGVGCVVCNAESCGLAVDMPGSFPGIAAVEDAGLVALLNQAAVGARRMKSGIGPGLATI
jgi:hypothetical protein